MNSPRIDEIARRLLESVPPGVRAIQKDLESNFRAVLRASLTKLDLVSRDEFDAQMRVLKRTRARLEELERRVAGLEGGGETGAGGTAAMGGTAGAAGTVGSGGGAGASAGSGVSGGSGASGGGGGGVSAASGVGGAAGAGGAAGSGSAAGPGRGASGAVGEAGVEGRPAPH